MGWCPVRWWPVRWWPAWWWPVRWSPVPCRRCRCCRCGRGRCRSGRFGRRRCGGRRFGRRRFRGRRFGAGRFGRGGRGRLAGDLLDNGDDSDLLNDLMGSRSRGCGGRRRRRACRGVRDQQNPRDDHGDYRYRDQDLGPGWKRSVPLNESRLFGWSDLALRLRGVGWSGGVTSLMARFLRYEAGYQRSSCAFTIRY